MAAGSTYTPIATTTLGSNSSTITFSSIPSTYTDLEIVCMVAGTNVSEMFFTFNGSSTGYSRTYLLNSGGAGASGRTTSSSSVSLGYINSASPNRVQTRVSLMNYSNTTTYKTMLANDSDSNAQVIRLVGLWQNTAAINQVTITAGTGSFVTGSTVTIYGIAAA